MDINLNTHFGEITYDETVIFNTINNIIKRITNIKIDSINYFKLNSKIIFDIKFGKTVGLHYNLISNEVQRQIRYNLNIDKFLIIIRN